MNKKNRELKDLVKEKYAGIVMDTEPQEKACCGQVSSCCESDYTVFSEDYTNKEGYNPDADLNLGCGIPTDFAAIKEGHIVLDLGSGAGNDVFVARSLTGEKGKVIGLDFTQEMIDKANQNKEKLGFSNIDFVIGDIEDMPLESNSVDVVISNCVLNLVPDKEKAFSEIFRVLKPGGHFCVSDVVLRGELPEGLKEAAEMYAGCVSGAIQIEEYLQIIDNKNFTEIVVQKEKEVDLSDDILLQYLNKDELMSFRTTQIGIFSITVFAKKP